MPRSYLSPLEPLCPFGDGRHKKRVWAGGGRSGFACVLCHKTWEWFGRSLLPTWPEKLADAEPDQAGWSP